ncbi:PLDc N-terminal domain-containing protein [uncultured Lacinutrix sp.]|uniref:PLDc N-terminal domain-containing protein n=1 Tax=uncultured Lacinutrix sp. TaxID=574032 RepID=UPI00345B6CF3
MNSVSPTNLFLISLILFGYISLSIWLVNKNEIKNKNKLLWTLLIICVPFLGSTIYFVKNLMSGDTQQVLYSK